MIATDEKPYGNCQDCGIDLADRNAVTAHIHATMAPTNELGVIACGHRVSIVNPTDIEVRASRARLAIQDALSSTIEDLYDDVLRGDLTVAEVSAEMWAFDLRNEWDDYVAEAEA